MNLFPVNKLLWFLETNINELSVTEDQTWDRQICMVGTNDWWLKWQPNISGGTWSLTAPDFRKKTIKDVQAPETCNIYTYAANIKFF